VGTKRCEKPSPPSAGREVGSLNRRIHHSLEHLGVGRRAVAGALVGIFRDTGISEVDAAAAASGASLLLAAAARAVRVRVRVRVRVWVRVRVRVRVRVTVRLVDQPEPHCCQRE
jgi:hypothetical protein